MTTSHRPTKTVHRELLHNHDTANRGITTGTRWKRPEAHIHLWPYTAAGARKGTSLSDLRLAHCVRISTFRAEGQQETAASVEASMAMVPPTICNLQCSLGRTLFVVLCHGPLRAVVNRKKVVPTQPKQAPERKRNSFWTRDQRRYLSPTRGDLRASEERKPATMRT